ncbi:unnamed protein product [Durusdinium trenchii]|uniref:Uncharacterized protein n=2 Tax=Durusdinium trenchii TaxID=1381693 RepID=A0ABP0M9S1_9DINO
MPDLLPELQRRSSQEDLRHHSMSQAEHLAFLKRSLARARIQNIELESLRQQEERELAEAYAQRHQQQAEERRAERRRNLARLKAMAKPIDPPTLLVEQDPGASMLLQQRPSLRQRLRLVLTPRSPRMHSSSSRSLSPRKPPVFRTPRRPKKPPVEVPSALEPQMPRKELLRATQHQLLKSCGLVIYKQQMKDHFKRIVEAVEVDANASAGQQKSAMSNLARPVLSEDRSKRH